MTKARELAELGKAVSVHDNRLDFDRAVVIPGLIDAAGTTAIADGSVTTAKIADDAVTTAKVNPAQTDITSVGTLTSFRSTGIDDNADALAITIDASEHVGIGITSPDGTLHVHSATAGSVTANTDADDLVVENSSHAGINILSPDANRSAIQFGHTSDNLKLQIRHDGGTSLSQIISDDALTFNVGGGAERIRVDTSGNVGIGNTNPNGGRLHVTNSTGAIGYFQSTQSASNVENIILNSTQTNSSANLSLQIENGTTAKGQVRLNGDNSIAIHNTTSLTERMRIHDNGNVGIGNTIANTFNSQGRNLVVGTGTGTDGMTIFSGSSSYGNIFFADGTSGSDPVRGGINYNHVNNSMNFRVNDAPRIYINSSGNVGIGTNNPATLLTLKRDSASSSQGNYALLAIDNGDANGFSQLRFQDDGAEIASIFSNSNQKYLIFRAGGSTERMRIDSNGYVNIATSSKSPELSHPGLTLRADVQGGYPTLLSLINQPGTGGTMGARIHMGYSSDYGTVLEFFGNPFNARAGGLRVRRLVGSGQSNISMQIGTDGALNVQGVYSQSTGSGANVNVASDGHMRRSTSSLKYKNTITDATHGLAEILKLRPVTYKGNNDGDTIFGGLIAEEVHDAGLTEFVQYNDDGEPDALAYGNMVSLCIKAIQELKAENTALANRITELENK